MSSGWSRLARVVGTVAGVILGAVLLSSAALKALDPHGFAEQIERLGLAHGSLALLLAVGVVALEAALGLALLVNLRRPAVLVLATCLMLAFLGLLGWEYLHPAEDASSCGCFGNLVQRTPGEALAEDVVFLALALLAWIGRPTSVGRLRWAAPVLGVLAGTGLAVAAPRLPVDDWATTLKPGARVADLKLDETVPETQSGTQLVLLLDRADERTRADVARVNEHLALPGGPVGVYGVAEDNKDLEVEFQWTAAPAFEVRAVPYAVLKPLYRTLPRAFVSRDGRVVRVWNEIPDDAALKSLAEGVVP
ncbi:MAG: hypothetical protein KBD01_07925 [Acidobacteria bacterium]|nr:hypothetical protein [Acidobacteriota bacterium]